MSKNEGKREIRRKKEERKNLILRRRRTQRWTMTERKEREREKEEGTGHELVSPEKHSSNVSVLMNGHFTIHSQCSSYRIHHIFLSLLLPLFHSFLSLLLGQSSFIFRKNNFLDIVVISSSTILSSHFLPSFSPLFLSLPSFFSSLSVRMIYLCYFFPLAFLPPSSSQKFSFFLSFLFLSSFFSLSLSLSFSHFCLAHPLSMDL